MSEGELLRILPIDTFSVRAQKALVGAGNIWYITRAPWLYFR